MTGIAELAGLAIPAALAGGVAGWLHIRSLRPVADGLLKGDPMAVVLQIARFVGLGIFLYLCARLGAAPLLAAAAGVLIGRAVVLRKTQGDAS